MLGEVGVVPLRIQRLRCRLLRCLLFLNRTHLFRTLLVAILRMVLQDWTLNKLDENEYPDARALCLFFLSSLNSSNFKSIRLRSLTAFLVPLELTLLVSILCPSRAEI